MWKEKWFSMRRKEKSTISSRSVHQRKMLSHSTACHRYDQQLITYDYSNHSYNKLPIIPSPHTWCCSICEKSILSLPFVAGHQVQHLFYDSIHIVWYLCWYCELYFLGCLTLVWGQRQMSQFLAGISSSHKYRTVKNKYYNRNH